MIDIKKKEKNVEEVKKSLEIEMEILKIGIKLVDDKVKSIIKSLVENYVDNSLKRVYEKINIRVKKDNKETGESEIQEMTSIA